MTVKTDEEAARTVTFNEKEEQLNDKNLTATTTISGHSRLHSRRLHRLVHPLTGRIFHIVHSPQEIENKRHALLQEDPKSDNFDVLVHGSDDHISTVRDIHRHHEGQRETLLQQNKEVLSRYDTVRDELDTLSHELTALTDHAVALDASFDKFGYSARIRTRTEGENTPVDDDAASTTSRLSRHEDRSITAIKFFRQPTVRQYFHKGLIWRSPNAGEVASFELFIDLVYVAVIDTIGHAAVQHASSASFLHYVIVFAISWKVWSDMMIIINWFEIDDIFGRLSVIFILCCLYAFTTNVVYFFEYTYTAGIAFYLASRFFTAIWFVVTGFTTPMIRLTLFYQAFIVILAAVLWIGSIQLEYPSNLPLIFIAIVIDLFASIVGVPFYRFITERATGKLSKFQKLIEYLPAINIEHRVERTGAFISLVFGYSVITILFQSHAKFPLNDFLGKGILGLIQAFVFNWIYFEIDAYNVHVHAIRRHYWSTFLWSIAHLPFAGGYILAASTLSELVIVHDTKNGSLEDLAEEYANASLDEAESALRWFYCGGLGVALICMSLISISHIHKRLPNPRLRKRPRLVIRVAIAIAIICLPLADPHVLNSLNLIATTTSLVILVLMLDLFGNSCAGDKFWTGGFCSELKKKKCYEAQCRIGRGKRKEMQRKLALGQTLGLEDILARKEMNGNKNNDSVTSFGSDDTVRVDGAEHGAGGY